MILDSYVSNYVLTTSNTLVSQIGTGGTDTSFGSNYSDKLGLFGSNYSDKLGVYSSNYSDKVGIYSSNYSDNVGIFGSNYSDKVGVWGSNYYLILDSYVSNYVLTTSNTLVSRIGTDTSFGSNYSSSLDSNASNYIVSTSNILVNSIGTEVGFGSNYIARINTVLTTAIEEKQNTLTAGQGITIASNTISAPGAWLVSTGTPLTKVYYNAGNVGIGTTDPQEELDIRGISPTIKLLDTREDGDAIIQFRETSDLFGMDIAYVGNIDNRMYIRSYNNSATAVNHVAINRTDGMIGIGTVSPATPLHIYNATSATLRIQTTTTTDASIELIRGTTTDASSDWIITNRASTGAFIITSSASGTPTDRFAIGNNGNVAIGSTNTASYKFNVNGTALIGGDLTVGSSAQSTARIFLGSAAAGDSGFTNSVIETRLYSGTENTELLLFKGNDISGTSGPDRIRLRAGSIVFDTYPAASTDRTAENIRMTIDETGAVGIGISNPSYPLEVSGGSTTTSVTVQNSYLTANGVTQGSTTQTHNLICAKFNNSTWCTRTIITSSDSRIKEDIQDINDDSALQMILAIQPKTYKYIDKLDMGNTKVYGFIAQQINDVVPEATSIQKSYIPNIMLIADYIAKIITLQSQPTKVIIKKDDKIKCYDKDNKNIYIEVEEVIDELKFKIKELETEYSDNKIFVYGTHVDDFHTLDKTYIYTLNVCATQELHRRIEAQNITIKAQEERIKVLELHEARIKELEAKVEQILR